MGEKEKEQEEPRDISSVDEGHISESHADEKEPYRADPDAQNRQDKLFRLYAKWCEYRHTAPTGELFSKWVKEPVEESADEKRYLLLAAETFWKQAVSAAEKVLQQIEAAEEKAKEREKQRLEQAATQEEVIGSQEEISLQIDADVHLYFSKGNMEVLLCVFPPFGDGAGVTKEAIRKKLEEMEVTTGIREDLISRIAEKQMFFQIFVVAEGIQPAAGKDGYVVEHIPREEFISFEEDEAGKVNYKDLHLFRNIKENDLICDIIPPQDGINGTDVKGNEVKAARGKAASVPAGNHTKLSSDGRQLIAASDGYISFQAGKFRIEDQLVINGNVDMAVGNQDFLGDIIVHGDVISGFSLKATGNIHVRGAVEGAVLTAGENIEISDGMKGNNRGELHAGESVRCSFLENVKVFAAGDIHVESMISCEVNCNGSVYVNQGLGVIIGGKITAEKSVTAKIIGSKANRKTEIFLGMMPETRAARDRKAEELQTVKSTKELLKKNIHFLQTIESLPAQKAEVLKQLIEQEELYEKIQQRLETELDKLNKMETDFRECFVKTGTAYPPTKVTIGGMTYCLETVSTKCNFYLSREGEVVLGVE